MITLIFHIAVKTVKEKNEEDKEVTKTEVMRMKSVRTEGKERAMEKED